MKKRYKVKKTGYLPILRDIQVLLQNRTINFTALGAYICFAFQANWDKRHDSYRAILPEDKEMAGLLGCNENTIYRNRIKLINIGLLEKLDGNTYVKNLDLFNMNTVKVVAKKERPVADLHTYFLKSEDELSKAIMQIEKMQEN